MVRKLDYRDRVYAEMQRQYEENYLLTEKSRRERYIKRMEMKKEEPENKPIPVKYVEKQRRRIHGRKKVYYDSSSDDELEKPKYTSRPKLKKRPTRVIKKAILESDDESDDLPNPPRKESIEQYRKKMDKIEQLRKQYEVLPSRSSQKKVVQNLKRETRSRCFVESSDEELQNNSVPAVSEPPKQTRHILCKMEVDYKEPKPCFARVRTRKTRRRNATITDPGFNPACISLHNVESVPYLEKSKVNVKKEVDSAENVLLPNDVEEIAEEVILREDFELLDQDMLLDEEIEVTGETNEFFVLEDFLSEDFIGSPETFLSDARCPSPKEGDNDETFLSVIDQPVHQNHMDGEGTSQDFGFESFVAIMNDDTIDFSSFSETWLDAEDQQWL